MSLDRNKVLMRRFYADFWCHGLADAVDELVTEDMVMHQAPADWPQGREGMREMVRHWRAAFPDMREEIHRLVAEGDLVVGHYTLTGTHRGGAFLGIAPTGNALKFSGMDIVRIEGGKIAEWWFHEDSIRFHQQLGVVPERLY